MTTKEAEGIMEKDEKMSGSGRSFSQSTFPLPGKRKGLKALRVLVLVLLLAFAGISASGAAERLVFNGEAFTDIQGYDFPADLQQISGNQLFTLNYSPLDSLGRPGMVSTLITKESVSGQRREAQSNILPTGFEQAKYPFIERGYLYQRCHLIGSQFRADTEIIENMVTGTFFMNKYGMYSLENLVAAYVLSSGNSVYYCVVPDFEGNELVCRGVTIAAVSLAAPEEFKFAKYCFNVQPGVIIDYSNGYSMLADTSGTVSAPRSIVSNDPEEEEKDYILNIKSHKFHDPNCSGVSTMKENNKQQYHGKREQLIQMGYTPCGTCNP